MGTAKIYPRTSDTILFIIYRYPGIMEDIRRKRGDYKAAVEKLAAGHVAEGLDRLDTMGAIKPMPAADLYGHATAISRHAQRDTGNPYQGFQIRHLRNPQRTRCLGIGLKH